MDYIIDWKINEDDELYLQGTKDGEISLLGEDIALRGLTYKQLDRLIYEIAALIERAKVIDKVEN